MDGMGNGVQMTYDLNRNQAQPESGYGWGGSWILWFLIIFILFAFMNRGAYGGAYGAAPYGGLATSGTNFIDSNFLYTNLTNQVRGLEGVLGQGFTQVTNQNFGLSKEMGQGFASVNQGIANIGYMAKDCCCETNRNIDRAVYNLSEGLCGVNRNIDASRFEAKSNTSDLSNMMQMLSMKNTAEMTAGFQRIMDRMSADKEDALKARITQLELGAAINAGNTRVINAVKPYPVPAYITCSPYETNIGMPNCGGFYPNR